MAKTALPLPAAVTRLKELKVTNALSQAAVDVSIGRCFWNMVQCGQCNKFRRFPPFPNLVRFLNQVVDDDDVEFECIDNTWDDYNSCVDLVEAGCEENDATDVDVDSSELAQALEEHTEFLHVIEVERSKQNAAKIDDPIYDDFEVDSEFGE